MKKTKHKKTKTKTKKTYVSMDLSYNFVSVHPPTPMYHCHSHNAGQYQLVWDCYNIYIYAEHHHHMTPSIVPILSSYPNYRSLNKIIEAIIIT